MMCVNDVNVNKYCNCHFLSWAFSTADIRFRFDGLYDVLGGIASPCVRTPWVVPWVVGLS